MRASSTPLSGPRIPTLFAAVFLLVMGSSFAHGAVITYKASLSGPNESPPNASPGVGTAQVDVNTTTNLMHVFVTFSGLTGNTTASHIHAPTLVAGTGTASVATTTPTFAGFPLGVKFGTYDVILDLTLASSYNPSYVTANGGTTAGAEAALLAALAADKAYLNIHSSTFGGGEIRGFLVEMTTPAQSTTWGRVKELYR
jgi:CHRD domain-containing protein